jgi:hypothetical protein
LVRQRRAALQSRYLFSCGCGACTGPDAEARDAAAEAPPPGVSPAAAAAARRTVDDALAAAADAATAGQTSPAAALLAAVVAAEGAVGPCAGGLHRLREAAARAAVEGGDWAAARRVCAASLPAYRHHYPPGSPLIGLQACVCFVYVRA